MHDLSSVRRYILVFDLPRACLPAQSARTAALTTQGPTYLTEYPALP